MDGDLVDGKYRLLRLLGQGGMGSVFEAESLSGGPHIALKLIASRSESEGRAASIGRFHREARAASAIDTEHIVRVLDVGTDAESGAPYMAMELLKGRDLESLLAEAASLHPEAALRIAAQVCIGLEKAHAARVIHRDIKPANIFLAERGAGSITVKILDFGIAKIKAAPGEQTSGLTAPHSMLGSPRYMSPEQARGRKDIDFATDLWSLGVVLYRALSGQPTHADAKSFGELVIRICTVPPRPIQELAPWVTPELASIVHTALALSPAERFPSATAMFRAILALLPHGHELHEDMLMTPGGQSPPLRMVVRVSGSADVDPNQTTQHQSSVAEPAAKPALPRIR